MSPDPFSFFSSFHLKKTQLEHALNVQQIAVAVSKRLFEKGVDVDIPFVYDASLLHDIGRTVKHDFTHCAEGARLLREAGFSDRFQRVCSTHFMAGLTREEAAELGLPRELDYLPASIEEKVIAYADNEADENKLERMKKHYGGDSPIYLRVLELKEDIERLMGGPMEKTQDFDAMVILKNDEGEFLLLKRNEPPVWEFPGGGIDWGESPEDAARREVKEECGLKIEVGKSLGTTSAVFEKKGKLKHAVYIVFEGKIVSGKPKISPEHSEFKWVKEKELGEMELGHNSKLALLLF